MRGTHYAAIGVIPLLAFGPSAMTAHAASRVATIEVKGMV
jgi:hypothetical protein